MNSRGLLLDCGLASELGLRRCDILSGKILARNPLGLSGRTGLCRLGGGLLALLQFIDQFLSVLEALRRRFRQRLHDQIADRGMNFLIDLDGCEWSLLENFVAHSFDVRAFKGLAVRHHLIKDAAPAKQIGACVERFSLDLLRGFVMQSGWDFAGRLRFEQPHGGNAES